MRYSLELWDASLVQAGILSPLRRCEDHRAFRVQCLLLTLGMNTFLDSSLMASLQEFLPPTNHALELLWTFWVVWETEV